ncbi:MAG: FGGY-family carbohydrate kinase [Gemmataceae bacterium]|nr:FGGY-family carbohydrate kinase [Gemmataceae bacterium]
MNILALEVGTARAAASLVDAATGAARGPGSQVAYEQDQPTPEAAELPAQRVWEAVASAARQAVRQAGVAGCAGDDVAGIGLCTFMPGLVLLGKDDRPVAPVWTHLDRRGRPAARQVWAHVGEEFLSTTGNRPLPGLISAISWRQQHSADPYIAHRVGSYLHVNGWLAFHMTGVKAFDPGNASVTGLFGTVADQAWSQRWCDYFEMERAWLPDVIDAGATVGALRAAIAAELAVPAGTPVKLGTGDIGTMMLASPMGPGDVLHISGNIETLAAATERPTPGPRRLIHRQGVGPGFVQVSHNPLGGAALEWFRNLCFREQAAEEFYQRTIPAARDRKLRVCFDPPFLAGDPLEVEARRAAFRYLELSSDRMDLLAALLDEMARRHQEALTALGQRAPIRRVITASANRRSWVSSQFPEAHVESLECGTLRGIARLFRAT